MNKISWTREISFQKLKNFQGEAEKYVYSLWYYKKGTGHIFLKEYQEKEELLNELPDFKKQYSLKESDFIFRIIDIDCFTKMIDRIFPNNGYL